jgi:hypothetical protein
LQGETVSIHIRRGDLLSEKGTLLSLSYYEQAIVFVGRTDKRFLIFSDDIAWCKQVYISFIGSLKTWFVTERSVASSCRAFRP